MVGGAICRALEKAGYKDVLAPGRDVLDLGDQAAVDGWFAENKPDQVFLAAAKVGGIHANSAYPAEFIHDNLVIETNVIHSAWKHGAKKLCFLGSSCIYPKHAPQPMKEEHLLTGPLEPTNEWYAIAKIAGVKMCQAYRRQYGFDAISLMPTNLYGPGDNFHPENSHVLPALIRRFHEAAHSGAGEVAIWGSGRPRREFLHVDDMAEASLFVLDLPREIYEANTEPMLSHINVGTGEDISILELAGLVAGVTGFEGKITTDPSRPDGTMRKLMDVSRLTAMGWRARIGLHEGIEETYRWYLGNADSVRT